MVELLPGVYTVQISDANGCSLTDSTTVTEPSSPVTVTVITTLSQCNQATGSATVIASGGTVGVDRYTYFWIDNNERDSSISNIEAGVYTVIASDNNGCTAEGIACISDSAGPIANISSTTHVSCHGGDDGFITITPISVNIKDIFPYYYCLDVIHIGDVIKIKAGKGFAPVIVTDSSGCKSVIGDTITEPFPLTITTSTTESLCGQAIGSATVLVNGGTTPYSYLWSSGATSSSISSLTSGIDTITITDANGCTIQSTLIILDSDGPSIFTTVSDVSCYNSNNGRVTATASGIAPFSWRWVSTDFTTDTISGLYAGEYQVVVTDSGGCMQSAIALVSQPEKLTFKLNKGIPSLDTLADAWAQVEATGGTPGYTYAWSDNVSTIASFTTYGPSSISGVLAGTYSITVSDANQCKISESFNIPAPSYISMTTCDGNSPYDYTAFSSACTTCSPCINCGPSHVFNIKTDFGAVGDGIHDDHYAFEWANDIIMAFYQSGVTLYIPAGEYLVGRQDVYGSSLNNSAFGYQGHHVICLNGCSNINIIGDQTNGVPTSKIKFKNCMRYGAFDYVTGKRHIHNTVNCSGCKNIGDVNDYKLAAYPGNFISMANCNNVLIKNLEVDGNSTNLSIGGYFSTIPDGIQLTHDGIFMDNCSNVKLDHLNVHHFGKDGLEIYSADKKLNSQVTNCKFNWNARTGIAWESGDFLSFLNCEANYNGFATFGYYDMAKGRNIYGSKMRAGLDIEYERSNKVSNGFFVNCNFKYNNEYGVICDQGYTPLKAYDEGFYFRNCNFVSSQYGEALQPNGRNFNFTCCNFYGHIQLAYDAYYDPSNEPVNNYNTKFFKCSFNEEYEDPAIGVKYAHVYQQQDPTSTCSVHDCKWYMIEFSLYPGRVLFDGCSFNTNYYTRWGWIKGHAGATNINTENYTVIKNSKFYNNELDYDGCNGSCIDNKMLAIFGYVDFSQNNTASVYKRGCGPTGGSVQCICYWVNNCHDGVGTCVGSFPLSDCSGYKTATSWEPVELTCSHDKYTDPAVPLVYEIYSAGLCNAPVCSTLVATSCDGDELRKMAPQDNAGFDVFPVPANGIINIINVPKGYQIKLRNLVGEILWEGNSIGEISNVDISKLPSGVYFVQVLGMSSKKIIKF